MRRHLVLRAPRRALLTKKGAPAAVSAAEAVRVIRSHERVYVHGVAATPTRLLDALAERHGELRGVELCHIHTETANPCSSLANKDAFFTNNLFVGANQRAQVAAGISSYVPAFLSDVPALMRRGLVRPDVALLNVSPPDRHGFCSLGVEVCAALPAAETAKTIIAQINREMPRTHGRAAIHINAIDYIVPDVDEPLPIAAERAPNAVNAAIGRHIASLVSDGATLQMGIGEIPNAVLAQLGNHRDLGVHTEMFQEGVISLIEHGVVTNMKKAFLPGRIVTAFIMGSRRLYDYVDDNVEVAFLEASITNSPSIIGTNPKVTAINSAVEVDLTGQVCADSIGSRIISGVGGQVDFERGAALSEGGVPIIALPSTTKTGDSRIVAVLKEGAGVTTTRNHVHYVVTEHGIAFLFGKNLLQRAKALIEIADPKHRAELERQAFERYKIKTWVGV